MTSRSTIEYWNRRNQRIESQYLHREDRLHWFYQKLSGKILMELLLTRPFFSAAYGAIANTQWSSKKISSFIHNFDIDMSEYEETQYRTFNDFFTRRFKPGARPFVENPNQLPAFAEGKYLGFAKIEPHQTFSIKGVELSASAILGDTTSQKERSTPFLGGPMLIARLSPADYHRCHYPDTGIILEQYTIPGRLHSTNPVSLKYQPRLYAINERQVALIETRNFGRLALVEVGAMLVGRIVQTHPKAKSFQRGQEKSYFLVGGSTVILMGEPGAWTPSQDILEQTTQGRETHVLLGESVGKRPFQHTAEVAPPL